MSFALVALLLAGIACCAVGIFRFIQRTGFFDGSGPYWQGSLADRLRHAGREVRRLLTESGYGTERLLIIIGVAAALIAAITAVILGGQPPAA